MTDATLAVATAERARRIAEDRGRMEAVVEAICRPGNWGPKVAYALGLQGQVETSVVAVRSSSRDASRTPLRVGFASDFHAGGLTDDRLLEQACQALADMQPDVLLLGGDFVAVRSVDVHRVAPLIAGIPAPLGKFAVLGNHDIRAGQGPIVAELERVGVQFIPNQRVGVDTPGGTVSIVGLDDSTRGFPRADALDHAHGTRIVLMHSPEALEQIGARHFDLGVCGHTHGGQVALPGGAPILMPGGPLNRRFHGGRYELVSERPRTLLVSRGIGCSGIPVRLFAAPQVHLCLIT